MLSNFTSSLPKVDYSLTYLLRKSIETISVRLKVQYFSRATLLKSVIDSSTIENFETTGRVRNDDNDGGGGKYANGNIFVCLTYGSCRLYIKFFYWKFSKEWKKEENWF